MPSGNKVFIDADAFVALADKDDPHHFKAKTINDFLEDVNATIITSNFAVGEAITVISQNTNQKFASEFGKKIFNSNIFIVDVSRIQEITALRKFAHATSKNVRFTDFVNLVLMEELGITTIFSFDKHYSQAGFTLLSSKAVL